METTPGPKDQVGDAGINGHDYDNATQTREQALIDIDDTRPSSTATIPACSEVTLQNLWNLIDKSDEELSTDIPALHRELRAFRNEVRQLRNADLPGNGTELWPTLHIVTCPKSKEATTYYLEQPSYIWDKQHDHLQGQRIVQQASWERRHPEKPFVVYLKYHCVESKEKTSDKTNSRRSDGTVVTTHESVHITSSSLLETLKEFFNASLILKAYWNGGVIDEQQSLHRPYHFYHHVHDQLKAFKDSLGDGKRQTELGLLIEYLAIQNELASANVAQTIASRQIALSDLGFLFAPGVLLLTKRDGVQNVVCQKSIVKTQTVSRDDKSRLASGDDTVDVRCVMEVTEVKFDGRFWARTAPLQLHLFQVRNRMIDLDWLDHFPLSLSSAAIREALVCRGRKFFDCRSGRYVTCDANSTEAGMGSCTRYMVDADAYRLVREREESTQQVYTKRDGLDPLNPGDDPTEDFLIQLPPFIQGFDMQAKTWNDILAADIEPVVWDKTAFGNLAIEKETKDLIQALIRNKIKSDQNIDFVKGKGSGLTVLLHGGPGTGKTLTAETVAEIAERPLYRVTCGALGISANDVENNLESVFHLGRRWGCVVLLDEADVFLEERQLSDLTRNALVSVFLRAMEYFDGIMILTSNRVGTFDEAFKSRIQLALHYQPLDQKQRHQIWENFIRNMEWVDEPINIDDIRSHLVELSKQEMNGRQIRNVINTARQLALFKEQPLNFEHLREVEQASARFDNYVRTNFRDNVDDELYAKELKIR